MRKFDPQRFQCAVTALALYRAKTRVVEQIRADGHKLSQFSLRQINEKREAYFAAHMEELITQAIEDAWRMPQFATHRRTQPKPVGLNN
jgi:hypothetical protein